MIIPVSGEEVIDVIEEMLTGRRALPAENSWLTVGVPALRKGDALIVPLVWARDASPAEQAAVREKVNRLHSDVLGALEYRWIFRHGIDLETPRAIDSPTYAAELLRTGARNAYWAGPGDSPRMIVCVIYGAPLPAPVDAVAVHVIPASWVDETLRTEPVPDIDLSWNWEQVIELDHLTIDLA